MKTAGSTGTAGWLIQCPYLLRTTHISSIAGLLILALNIALPLVQPDCPQDILRTI